MELADAKIWVSKNASHIGFLQIESHLLFLVYNRYLLGNKGELLYLLL